VCSSDLKERKLDDGQPVELPQKTYDIVLL